MGRGRRGGVVVVRAPRVHRRGRSGSGVGACMACHDAATASMPGRRRRCPVVEAEVEARPWPLLHGCGTRPRTAAALIAMARRRWTRPVKPVRRPLVRRRSHHTSGGMHVYLPHVLVAVAVAVAVAAAVVVHGHPRVSHQLQLVVVLLLTRHRRRGPADAGRRH
ncbi:hypothetical protein IWZ00DRAFT_509494 [Phyllosticta capitalensis]|uniref:Uncharacterized protein n=1 Tax=Phyllosticta capitalensis TaxID=121624 RepID=A0ABR1YKC6_9PEZI